MGITREIDLDPPVDPLALALAANPHLLKPGKLPQPPRARLIALFLERCAAEGHVTRADVEAAGFTEGEIVAHRRAAAAAAAKRGCLI